MASPETKKYARSLLRELERDSQDILGYIQYRTLKELTEFQSRISGNDPDLQTIKLRRRFMSFQGNKILYGKDAFVLPSNFYSIDEHGHEVLALMNLAELASWVLKLSDNTEDFYSDLANAIPHAFVNITIPSRGHWSEKYKLEVLTILFAKQCNDRNHHLSISGFENLLHQIFSAIDPSMEVQHRINTIVELLHTDGPHSIPKLFTVDRFLIRMAEFIRACCFLKGFPLPPDEREEEDGGIEESQDQEGRSQVVGSLLRRSPSVVSAESHLPSSQSRIISQSKELHQPRLLGSPAVLHDSPMVGEHSRTHEQIPLQRPVVSKDSPMSATHEFRGNTHLKPNSAKRSFDSKDDAHVSSHNKLFHSGDSTSPSACPPPSPESKMLKLLFSGHNNNGNQRNTNPNSPKAVSTPSADAKKHSPSPHFARAVLEQKQRDQLLEQLARAVKKQ